MPVFDGTSTSTFSGDAIMVERGVGRVTERPLDLAGIAIERQRTAGAEVVAGPRIAAS
jgi:hypothetical protein